MPSHRSPSGRPRSCILEEDPNTVHGVPRLFLVFGLAALLAFQPPIAGDAPSTAEDGSVEGRGPWITFRTDGTTGDLASIGAVLLEAYPSFLVARGPAESMDLLAARGHHATELRDASLVRFLSGPVEVRDLARATVPWALDERGNGIGVVHVHAPWKTAWGQEWRARGVEVLRYVPANGFLVRGPPAAIEGLAGLPYVDGVAPFAPAWKIRPGLPSEGLVDVRIVVLPGIAPEPIVAWLGHRGIPGGAPRFEVGPGILGAYGSGDFRWIRARIPAGLVSILAGLPQVEFIEPVRIPRPWNAETAWAIQVGSNATLRYWQAGLDGRGQVVAISDTGADYDHPQFRHASGQITLGDIYNTTDSNRRKVVRYVNMGVLTGLVDWPGGAVAWDSHSIGDSRYVSPSCTFGHGTLVASVLTGNDDGLYTSANDGNALGAKLYVQDIGTVVPGTPCATDALVYLPDDYTNLFGPPGLVYNDPNAPVRIHSNSWGTDVNEYDIQARMIDAFVWSHPEMTILFAVGNAGSLAKSVGTPGTAKNILTVGGAGNPDLARTGGINDVAAQSSRGPTSDGRLKPTIVGIFDGDSGASDGNPMSNGVVSDIHWDGTSYSTPSAAAAAAIVRQYFTDGWYPAARPVAGNARIPSAALIRATLIASAVQMTGSGMTSRFGENVWPNNEQGFGRLLLSNALPIADAGDTYRTQLVDERVGLLTGEAATYTFRIAGPRTAKFVLVWSDFPGTVGAGKALMNNLDLEVTAPDGTVYLGNNFGTMVQGQSVPGGTFDGTNVEEAVIVRAPATGEWRARVIGGNVPVGPQPFALVATADLDASYGRVALDRPSYRGSDTIRIEVEDAGAASVQVLARSDFEPAGEIVTLGRSAPEEVWRARIDVGFGPASRDGILQVRHGDTVRVEYADPAPAHTAVATARIDARGPIVWDVVADRPSTTSVQIRWQTDEPATSGVRYGTLPSDLLSAAETPELATSHELLVSGLQAETLYYFDVVSRDRGGAETRDTNGGRHYRFRTDAFGDVLLVIGHHSFPEEREAMWGSALDAHGWTWSPWRVSEVGRLPSLALLQAHRVVAWQVGLEQYPPFNHSARDLVKQYIDGGGRFLLSSHDTSWALTDSTSQFFSVESEIWVRGVLKSDLDCDPTRALQLRGVAGDPITSAYQGAVSYQPHRDGGAVDELLLFQIGGTTVSVWTDAQVTPPSCGSPSAHVGLRWFASGNNGTAGIGTWGDTPSRLVYFAFELTGLDATATDPRPTSPTRAQVLDNALRWLVSAASSSLDRDHPEVTITSPNGGTFAGPTIPIDWTATGGGVPIASFDLSYSNDGGQTWSSIATVPGSARTYLWDVSGLGAGDRYLVRIVANDSGTPSLRGRDESDGPFAIRIGGDGLGPTLWAGSVRVAPFPPGAGTPIWINGTADDSGSGSSPIAAAEFFLSPTVPDPGESGFGRPMVPTDGAFDGPVEGLSWFGILTYELVGTCIWVHAQDAAGNWGPFVSDCFQVVPGGPDRVAFLIARLAGGNADVEITWSRATDEGLAGGTVRYRILRATSPQGPGTQIDEIVANGTAAYTFTDLAAGSGDPSDYFYRIETVDASGNGTVTVALAAKFHPAVAAGANLLGMPVSAPETNLASIASGIPWQIAWSFDGCGATPQWESARPAEASALRLGIAQGFWFNATAPGTLLVVGIVPATAWVELCAGWNLVGLPGFASGVTVGSVKAATRADLILGFDPTDPYHTRVLGDTEVLAPGQGFWIRVPADAVWTVPGS